MPYQDPDPTDPMTLHAMGLETDDPEVNREMAMSFIEEFMRMGYGRDRLLAMFQIPQYIGPHLAYQALGEAGVAALIDEVAGRWGGRRDGSAVRRDEHGNVRPDAGAESAERRKGMNTVSHCQHDAGARPKDILMSEHRVIERVLDAVERMLGAGVIDGPFLRQAVDFFRNFADGCHHAKEEEALFPALEQAGIPRLGGPVGVMLHEHEEGRRLLAAILDQLDAAAVDPQAAARVRAAAAGYVRLLREHIGKEDQVLFVMADHVLAAEAQQGVLEKFERIEAAEGREGRHDRYLKRADELQAWEFNA